MLASPVLEAATMAWMRDAAATAGLLMFMASAFGLAAMAQAVLGAV